MEVRYDMLLDSIKKLSLHEKEELRNLIEKYIIEERRGNIYKNYLQSLDEYKRGNLKFSSNIEELKNDMESE